MAFVRRGSVLHCREHTAAWPVCKRVLIVSSRSLLPLPVVVLYVVFVGRFGKTKMCQTTLAAVARETGRFHNTRAYTVPICERDLHTHTHSARDVRVRLGLVALPFPSRASFDKIPGRYSLRREVLNHVS